MFTSLLSLSISVSSPLSLSFFPSSAGFSLSTGLSIFSGMSLGFVSSGTCLVPKGIIFSVILSLF